MNVDFDFTYLLMTHNTFDNAFLSKWTGHSRNRRSFSIFGLYMQLFFIIAGIGNPRKSFSNREYWTRSLSAMSLSTAPSTRLFSSSICTDSRLCNFSDWLFVATDTLNRQHFYNFFVCFITLLNFTVHWLYRSLV